MCVLFFSLHSFRELSLWSHEWICHIRSFLSVLFFSFILPFFFFLCMLDCQSPFTEVSLLLPFEKSLSLLAIECVCVNLCDHGLTWFCMHEPRSKTTGGCPVAVVLPSVTWLPIGVTAHVHAAHNRLIIPSQCTYSSLSCFGPHRPIRFWRFIDIPTFTSSHPFFYAFDNAI